MSKITTSTFNINVPSVNLIQGEELIFKLHLDGMSSSITSSFTASLGEGNLKITSLSTITGYASTTSSFFDSASIALSSNTNEIILSTGVTSFYGGNYIQSPNPLTGSVSSLYDTYGDIDYTFVSKPFDMIIVYLSDGTYVEATIKDVYISSQKLHLVLNTELSVILKNNLANQTYTRFLLLSRQPDETNTILSFIKRDGKTSYGFLIPEDLSQDVLNNIDTITREVKQKLLNDQSPINDISGGTFG